MKGHCLGQVDYNVHSNKHNDKDREWPDPRNIYEKTAPELGVRLAMGWEREMPKGPLSGATGETMEIASDIENVPASECV